jgi:hypothetical protein
MDSHPILAGKNIIKVTIVQRWIGKFGMFGKWTVTQFWLVKKLLNYQTKLGGPKRSDPVGVWDASPRKKTHIRRPERSEPEGSAPPPPPPPPGMIAHTKAQSKRARWSEGPSSLPMISSSSLTTAECTCVAAFSHIQGHSQNLRYGIDSLLVSSIVKSTIRRPSLKALDDKD